MASIKAAKFSNIFFSSNEALPIETWMLAVLSRRNSTRPALDSVTARPISSGADDGAGLGVRHQAARTEHTAQFTDLAHHIRRGDGDIEIEPAALDLGQGLIVIGDGISTGIAGIGGAITLGEDQHAHGLAQTMRQDDHIAHLLVGLAGVETHAHVDFHSGVEFCVGSFFYQFDRFSWIVELIQIHFGQRRPGISFRV